MHRWLLFCLLVETREVCSQCQRSFQARSRSSVGGPRYLVDELNSLAKLPSQNSTASHMGAAKGQTASVSDRRVQTGRTCRIVFNPQYGETFWAHSRCEGDGRRRAATDKRHIDVRSRTRLPRRATVACLRVQIGRLREGELASSVAVLTMLLLLSSSAGSNLSVASRRSYRIDAMSMVGRG